jgi:hypothetical protein
MGLIVNKMVFARSGYKTNDPLRGQYDGNNVRMKPTLTHLPGYDYGAPIEYNLDEARIARELAGSAAAGAYQRYEEPPVNTSSSDISSTQTPTPVYQPNNQYSYLQERVAVGSGPARSRQERLEAIEAQGEANRARNRQHYDALYGQGAYDRDRRIYQEVIGGSQVQRPTQAQVQGQVQKQVPTQVRGQVQEQTYDNQTQGTLQRWPSSYADYDLPPPRTLLNPNAIYGAWEPKPSWFFEEGIKPIIEETTYQQPEPTSSQTSGSNFISPRTKTGLGVMAGGLAAGAAASYILNHLHNRYLSPKVDTNYPITPSWYNNNQGSTQNVSNQIPQSPPNSPSNIRSQMQKENQLAKTQQSMEQWQKAIDKIKAQKQIEANKLASKQAQAQKVAQAQTQKVAQAPVAKTTSVSTPSVKANPNKPMSTSRAITTAAKAAKSIGPGGGIMTALSFIPEAIELWDHFVGNSEGFKKEPRAKYLKPGGGATQVYNKNNKYYIIDDKGKYLEIPKEKIYRTSH